MSKSTTRRALLAGAAAAIPAAVAVPAVASAACIAPAERIPPEGFERAYDARGKLWFKAVDDDPIFAAIEAHRVAQMRAQAVLDSDDEDVTEPIFIAADEALVVVLATTPTTLAGCIALLRHLAWREEDAAGSEGNPFEAWSEQFSKPGSTLYLRLAQTLERAAVMS